MSAGLLDLVGCQMISPLAYIGPGADLALISSVIGLVVTLGSSTLFLMLWPIRSMWRRLRGSDKVAANTNSTSNS
jgi:hypothetical protein